MTHRRNPGRCSKPWLKHSIDPLRHPVRKHRPHFPDRGALHDLEDSAQVLLAVQILTPQRQSLLRIAKKIQSRLVYSLKTA